MNLLVKIKCPDFVSLDTLGFAQVGEPTYNSKIESEKKIISDFFKDTEELAVPLPFVEIAMFQWKKHPHDFGNYWDFVILYDKSYIDFLEEQDEESYVLFWAWIDRCQCALSNNETELLSKCKIDYEKFS